MTDLPLLLRKKFKAFIFSLCMGHPVVILYRALSRIPYSTGLEHYRTSGHRNPPSTLRLSVRNE